MAKTYSAGVTTAYGAAKRGGYTGTYEQFCADQANFARYAQQVREDKESVEQTVETFSETTVPAAVQSVEDKGTEQIGLVDQAGTTQVQNVNNAGTTQTDAVNLAGTTNVNAVNQAGETQVGNVRTEGNTQVQAVEDKGDEVIASIPSDYSDLTAEVGDLSRQLNDETTGLDTKAPVIVDTASGAIASFADGADGMPIRKLVAQIEPVQDLHGYDHPWPAGGGKNLIDVSDRTLSVDNEYYKQVALNFAPTAGVTYTISVDVVSTVQPFGVSIGCGETVYSADLAFNNELNNGRVSLSFTPTETQLDGRPYLFMRLPRFSTPTTVTVEAKNFQLELGSTSTPYSPYSNICPISGHTGAEIEQAGKNMASFTNGYSIGLNGLPMVYAKRSATTTPILIKSGATYKGICSGTNVFLIYSVLDANNALVRRQTAVTSGAVLDTSGGKYLYVCGYDSADTNTITAEGNGLMVVEGSESDTSYAPYTGNQISVTFPSEAGTVYGGTLTLNPDRTGTLVVDRAEHAVSPNDTTSLYQSGQNANRVGIRLPDSQLSSTTNDRLKIKSNIAKADVAILTASTQKVGDCCMYSGGTDSYSAAVFGVPLAADTASDAKAWLIEQECKFVYYLAEPITYQLTAEQVSGILTTLYGTNNIWTDTGDTEVEYPCDTKLYIDNKITQAIAAALNA